MGQAKLLLVEAFSFSHDLKELYPSEGMLRMVQLCCFQLYPML